MSRIFITDKADVIIRIGLTPVTNENVILDLAAKTIEVLEEIDGQAMYSALIDYWHNTADMSELSFPYNAIDDTSAKYQLGFDGVEYNGWDILDLTSKKNIKSAGWRAYNTNGTVKEEWFGAISTPLGVADTDQPYYQLETGGSPVNFTFAGPVNEPVQVFGDASHGNLNKRVYFKMFCREYLKEYASADLPSVNRTKTGPFAQAFGLVNKADNSISHADVVVNASPYSLLTLTYYAADQTRSVGASSIATRQIIDNTSSALDRYEIYERMQHQLRQNIDIDVGAGVVNGKTADQVCFFVGPILHSYAYIDGLLSDDLNFVVIYDKNRAPYTYPYAASGTFDFNAVLQSLAGAKYTVYYKTLGAGYGNPGAVMVLDKDGVEITGTIGGVPSISWSYDFDGEIAGGLRSITPALPVICDLVVTAPGTAKPLLVQFTINRANGQAVSVNGTSDPVYIP